MKYAAVIVATMSVLLLSGCTLGPKVENKTVYVRTNNSAGDSVIVGRVAENKKLKVELVTEKGEIVDDVIDIGGWEISPPKENK